MLVKQDIFPRSETMWKQASSPEELIRIAGENAKNVIITQQKHIPVGYLITANEVMVISLQKIFDLHARRKLYSLCQIISKSKNYEAFVFTSEVAMKFAGEIRQGLLTSADFPSGKMFRYFDVIRQEGEVRRLIENDNLYLDEKMYKLVSEVLSS